MATTFLGDKITDEIIKKTIHIDLIGTAEQIADVEQALFETVKKKCKSVQKKKTEEIWEPIMPDESGR